MRAATAGELVNMRADGQSSRLYLSIHNPATVFAARINQTFASLDKVAQITFDTVTTGAYTDIKVGQTVWIGSSAGAYDIGQARVRKAATSSVLYIGETSELALADNQYITVVNSFELWPRHPLVKRDMTILEDYDLTYSNQHSAYAPVPVMGPPAVLWLTGATVTFQPTGAASWCLSAGTMTYLWTATGASATANMTTATPTITYNAAGTYIVSLTCTVGGVSTTGYRVVFVHSAASMPVTQFELNNCAGSYSGGGWSFDVTLYGEAATSTVRDRALVVLHAKDFVKAAAITSAGILSNTAYDGIVAVGWIAGETIRMNANNGSVTFGVRGPQYWLGQMSTGPASFTGVRNAPAKWSQFASMTTDKMLWHLAYWRSTTATVIDVYRNSDTRNATQVDTTTGPLWAQMTDIASMILAQPVCNRFGQLYWDVDPQVVPAASRSGWSVVLTLRESDCAGEITVTRLQHPVTSRVDLSGDVVTSSLKSGLVYSLSNGHIWKRHGQTVTLDRLLLSSQAQANALAGLVAGRDNARYTFDMQLAQNNRLLDVTPAAYVTMYDWTADNVRGVTYTGNTIIREVSHQLNAGALQTSVTLVAESIQENSANGDIPIDPGSAQTAIAIPSVAAPSVPAIPPFKIPVNTPQAALILMADIPGSGIYYTPNINDSYPTWGPMDIGLSDSYAPRQICMTAAGVCYAMDDKNIYRAIYPGAAWFVIADESDLIAAHGPGDWKWMALGVDEYGGALAAMSGADFSFASLMWYASDGETLLDTISPANNAQFAQAMLSYGDTVWRLSYIAGGGNNIVQATFNSDLSAQLDYSIGGVAAGTTHYATEGGTFYVPANTRYDDNDLDAPVTVTYPADLAGATIYQRLGVDPTGQYLVFTVGATLYKSSDYGANWTTATSPLNDAEVASFCKVFGQNDWVICQEPSDTAKVTTVWYTDDAGATWQDANGGLLALTPDSLPTPSMIRGFMTEPTT